VATMIRHIVIFRASASSEKVQEALKGLEQLKDKIPGILSFSGGPYSSNEGLNQGYTHAFTMDFKDASSRDAYLPHKDHQAAAKLLVDCLAGPVKEHLIAFDYELSNL